jgi:hypothetical protein
VLAARRAHPAHSLTPASSAWIFDSGSLDWGLETTGSFLDLHLQHAPVALSWDSAPRAEFLAILLARKSAESKRSVLAPKASARLRPPALCWTASSAKFGRLPPSRPAVGWSAPPHGFDFGGYLCLLARPENTCSQLALVSPMYLARLASHSLQHPTTPALGPNQPFLILRSSRFPLDSCASPPASAPWILDRLQPNIVAINPNQLVLMTAVPWPATVIARS